MPDEAPARLRKNLQLNSIANLRSLGAILKISAAFVAVHFPFILLKGIPLAEILCGGLAERKIADVDILILAAGMTGSVRAWGNLNITPSASLTRSLK